MIKKILFSFLLASVLLPSNSVAQILVTNTTQYTPSELVNTVLVNSPCISVSNITSATGAGTDGIGYFTNTNPNFPIESGIVLSTGSVASIPGPNDSTISGGGTSWPGDAELQQVLNPYMSNSVNATKLEFDFIAQNNFFSFNFLFASEEYGTYQCSFSDGFAFLLTDLETGVKTNLAVVPGTSSPISVVTIRDSAYNGGCNSQNPEYFDAFFGGSAAADSATDFNGQTVLMTASATIIPNHPYHIKIVISDNMDATYDSAVFIEAGSFNTGTSACADGVKLVAFFDQNGNGLKDGSEMNFTYGNFTSEQNNSGAVNSISSPFGTYTIYDTDPLNTYDFNFEVNPEFAAYYSVGTTSYSDITIPVSSSTTTLYFPVTLIQSYSDVNVTILPVTPPVAGADLINRIVYTNSGLTPASGTITFTNDPVLTITNVTPSGSVTIPTGFTFVFTNLLPYETRSIDVQMSVPAIPTVNINDIVTNNVSIPMESGDVDPDNNSFSNSQVVVASYDPNDKMEAHGGEIMITDFDADDYLFYTVRFQNTGTSNAINVRIEDVLDAMLDAESIRMVGASHDYVMERTGNSVVFRFADIQLPPAETNELLSQGFVTFKIKMMPGFVVGDVVPNVANIFFDSNPPITTNIFNTEFIASLGNATFDSANLIVHPNPTKNSVNIHIQNSDNLLSEIVIYDILGKIVQISKPSSQAATIDVSKLSSGIYLIEIMTQNNHRQIRKLVIQ